MTKVMKWNFKTREYEDADIPDHWDIRLCPDDMMERVNCVCCGKSIRFATSYTSRVFRNPNGFGYAECYECYEKHWYQERRSMRNG